MLIALTRIIHEYLLQRQILSRGEAFLVRAPRRTATIAVSRNGRLTIAPARTKVALCYSSRRAPCEKSRRDFGRSRFTAAFMNNPG